MQCIFSEYSAIHYNLRTLRQSCEKMFAMLIFDASHMTEKLWGCSIFRVDHAISFKNVINTIGRKWNDIFLSKNRKR